MIVEAREVDEFRIVVDDESGEVGVIASGDRYREITRDVVVALCEAYAQLDPKRRGPSYERGRADGFNACRAGVPNPTEENKRG